MTSTQEDDKPWKTDLARKSAQRREQVLHEVEDAIKKASSFEEALRQAVEIMKKRFARYSAVTAYVADGEDLAVHTSLDRPQGPDRVGSGGGPLADAGHGHATTVVSDLSAHPGWAAVGPHQRQRHGRAGAHRGRPLGHRRGLERFPRRLHRPGRRSCWTR